MLDKKQKEPYLLFYKILGFAPDNIEFYKMAMIHRSSAIKSKTGEYINNERLEFLGDAVLGAVIADVLYHYQKKGDEGFLSNARSKIVQRETLNNIAIGMGLDKLIVTSKKNNIQKNNIFGNAFEALIGAIYLDKGYKYCQRFVKKKILTSCIDLDKTIKKEINFKSKILEISQKHKINVVFDSSERKIEGNHKVIFQTEILMNGVSVSHGTGNSKKESQQDASKSALRKLRTNGLLQYIIQNKQSEEENVLVDNDGNNIE